jgi:hypothetical protein
MGEAIQIDHGQHHRMLVRQLSSEITPRRPLLPVSVCLALWAGLDAVLVVWVMSHTTNDFKAKLIQPPYLVEVVFFMIASLISAALALRSAIPGRALSAAEAVIATALVITGTVVVIFGEPMDTSTRLREFTRIGLICSRETVIIGALPWVGLWWLAKRGASMNGWLSGLLVGGGALLFSFAIMRIACPIDEPLHLLTWHLLPVLIVIVLSTVVGSFSLRFRPRPRQIAG